VAFNTSVQAELRVLRDGLSMAVELGISCLQVERDADTVVNIVTGCFVLSLTNYIFPSC
jgi:ribonuclease HI